MSIECWSLILIGSAIVFALLAALANGAVLVAEEKADAAGDKRTKRFQISIQAARKARRFSIAMAVLAAMSSSGLLYVGQQVDAQHNQETRLLCARIKSLQRDAEMKNGKIDHLRSQNDDLVEGKNELVQGKNELVDGKNEILDQNGKLQLTVEKYQSDLRSSELTVQRLKSEVKKARNGFLTWIDYNGVTHEMKGTGNFNASPGEEWTARIRMQELKQAGKWHDLAELCKRWFMAKPDWLRPHLFMAEAYFNLGKEDKAISEIEYVLEESEGDPDYNNAAETLLNKIKGN